MKTTKFLPGILLMIIVVATACQSRNNQDTNEEITSQTPEPVDANTPIETVDVTANNDTIVLASGLRMIITNEGTGPRPVQGKKVKVHYTGYLTDGTKFDSSVDRGEPLEFNVGTGAVIKGWDEGISLMNVGSKAKLIIPHELAYGVNGMPGVIPPSATLIFDVELVDAEQ